MERRTFYPLKGDRYLSCSLWAFCRGDGVGVGGVGDGDGGWGGDGEGFEEAGGWG